MQYRDFGKTGIKISQLGFGCMRLPEINNNENWNVDDEKSTPMIRRAYELGVNYFDTAVFYCHGNSQSALGKAVKPFRDKILLSTKCPLNDSNSDRMFWDQLEDSLKKLDTDYIDFYHFHGINRNSFDNIISKLNLMDCARRAIDQKMIRHISFSFHDNPDNMAYIIERGEIFSSVLMQYNLLDRNNEKALENAHEKGLGTVIMGPVAGGRLAAPSDLYEKLLGKKSGSTPELAMRFVLGNKNVSCALSGMTNIEMVEQNAGYTSDEISMTEEDHQKAVVMLEEIKRLSDLYCTGCAYCMPCPCNIDIPRLFSSWTYYNVYGLRGHGKHMYSRLETKGDACAKCGSCAKKCPQQIDIPGKIEEINRILGA